MVIAYNHNLHFKIHYKKFQKQDYNSFHHNLTIQEILTKDEHIIPCVEKNPKTTLKICAISKQSLWFSITSTSNSSYSLSKL
jgi:hypothetical protein